MAMVTGTSVFPPAKATGTASSLHRQQQAICVAASNRCSSNKKLKNSSSSRLVASCSSSCGNGYVGSDESNGDTSFWERLRMAWKVLFPPAAAAAEHRTSNAQIAKQRLKMILVADRCAVSNEAKQKIVNNIVAVLSDFVEIESEEQVQLSVSAHPDLGTIYSVTVPVRRVKAEFQQLENQEKMESF